MQCYMIRNIFVFANWRFVRFWWNGKLNLDCSKWFFHMWKHIWACNLFFFFFPWKIIIIMKGVVLSSAGRITSICPELFVHALLLPNCISILLISCRNSHPHFLSVQPMCTLKKWRDGQWNYTATSKLASVSEQRLETHTHTNKKKEKPNQPTNKQK